MKNPVVQYLTFLGWKDLVIMDETICDISKAVEMVRASSRANIELKQVCDDGLRTWDNIN